MQFLECVLLLVFDTLSEFTTGVCTGMAWGLGSCKGSRGLLLVGPFNCVVRRHRSLSQHVKRGPNCMENRQTLFDVAIGRPPSDN